MRITEAAQAVQRSGFPEAYEDHAEDARALASALTGQSPDGQFSCVVRHDRRRGVRQARRRRADRARGRRAPGPGGGVRRPVARRVRARAASTDGHMEGSAHYEGRAHRRLRAAGRRGQPRQGLGDRVLPRRPGRTARRSTTSSSTTGSGPPAAAPRSGWRDYDPGTPPASRPRPSPSSSTATTCTSTSSTDPPASPPRRGVTSCVPRCHFLRVEASFLRAEVSTSCAPNRALLRAQPCVVATEGPRIDSTDGSARKDARFD